MKMDAFSPTGAGFHRHCQTNILFAYILTKFYPDFCFKFKISGRNNAVASWGFRGHFATHN